MTGKLEGYLKKNIIIKDNDFFTFNSITLQLSYLDLSTQLNKRRERYTQKVP